MARLVARFKISSRRDKFDLRHRHARCRVHRFSSEKREQTRRDRVAAIRAGEKLQACLAITGNAIRRL